MINNSRYISHEVIIADLSRIVPDKKFSSDDVMEWCQIVECRHIKDIETMYQYIGIPLTVVDNKTLIPCNVYRMLDIYSNPNSPESFVECSNNGEYLCNIPDAYDIIYVNYVGTPIADDGTPLIAKGHENACVKYCLTQAFMGEWMNGTLNAGIYQVWQQEFSGQILNARYNFKHKTRKDIDDINKIRANMVPKIGRLQILNHG